MAALLISGCVTAGRHGEVVAERDLLLAAKRDLEEQVGLLKIANRSLDDQVAALVDSNEDLLEERGGLEQDLVATRKSGADLARELKEREEELAAAAAALASQASRVEELQGTYEGLVRDLEAEVAAGQIRIDQLAEGLDVGVAQDILFPSGSASLSREGMEVLRTVATRLAGLPYEIEVQGHSDNIAIRGQLTERYPTNWELAGARASSVVRLFLDAGIDPLKLSAVSYGPYRPVAANDTPEGRAQNRRIEIRLRPRPNAPTSPTPGQADAAP